MVGSDLSPQLRALPLKLGRNYPRYHEMDAYERRATIAELRVGGCSAKAIAGYLGAHRTTVYQALSRFEEEGIAGLAEKPAGGRRGEEGDPRGHRGGQEARGRQDLNAFLAVLYGAVKEYGPPEAFVTDSGSIFLATRAQAIYRALGIRKLEIERGNPRRATWKPPGASREGWPTTTSRRPRIGPSYSKSTIGGCATTTSRSTTPTGIAGRADDRRRRSSLGSRHRASRRKTSPGRSSRPATRVPSTTSATSSSSASGSTPRRGSR